MKDNRRGFLKTLGKLGAALGITTVAAACSAHHHGHGPHHPKHPATPKGSPDDSFHLASEAKPHTAPKAKIKPLDDVNHDLRWGKNRDKVKGQIKFASNVCVTNRPDVSKAVEMTSRHQEWLNRMTLARLDNISITLNPTVLLKDLTK